jgi:hypothetical protein
MFPCRIDIKLSKYRKYEAEITAYKVLGVRNDLRAIE